MTISTLNINGLDAPIKGYRLVNWIKSQDPLLFCIQEAHLTCKDTPRLKALEEDLPNKWRTRKKEGFQS